VSGPIVPPVGRITPMEGKVLGLILAGYTTRGIAGQLERSVNTIETHRRSLARKIPGKRPFELRVHLWAAGCVAELL
jgi:DNA-binding CsgD family transcriptional regulator